MTETNVLDIQASVAAMLDEMTEDQVEYWQELNDAKLQDFKGTLFALAKESDEAAERVLASLIEAQMGKMDPEIVTEAAIHIPDDEIVYSTHSPIYWGPVGEEEE